MRLLDRFSRAGAVRLTGVLSASLVVAGACLGASTALASGVWSAPTAIESGGSLYSVSCSSATFCRPGAPAAGRTDAATYNGTSWSAPTNIPASTTSSPCLVRRRRSASPGGGDYNGKTAANALTYNGTSWSATNPPSWASSARCILLISDILPRPRRPQNGLRPTHSLTTVRRGPPPPRSAASRASSARCLAHRRRSASPSPPASTAGMAPAH